jgi:hypothetical protein
MKIFKQAHAAAAQKHTQAKMSKKAMFKPEQSIINVLSTKKNNDDTLLKKVAIHYLATEISASQKHQKTNYLKCKFKAKKQLHQLAAAMNISAKKDIDEVILTIKSLNIKNEQELNNAIAGNIYVHFPGIKKILSENPELAKLFVLLAYEHSSSAINYFPTTPNNQPINNQQLGELAEKLNTQIDTSYKSADQQGAKAIDLFRASGRPKVVNATSKCATVLYDLSNEISALLNKFYDVSDNESTDSANSSMDDIKKSEKLAITLTAQINSATKILQQIKTFVGDPNLEKAINQATTAIDTAKNAVQNLNNVRADDDDSLIRTSNTKSLGGSTEAIETTADKASAALNVLSGLAGTVTAIASDPEVTEAVSSLKASYNAIKELIPASPATAGSTGNESIVKISRFASKSLARTAATGVFVAKGAVATAAAGKYLAKNAILMPASMAWNVNVAAKKYRAENPEAPTTSLMLAVGQWGAITAADNINKTYQTYKNIAKTSAVGVEISKQAGVFAEKAAYAADTSIVSAKSLLQKVDEIESNIAATAYAKATEYSDDNPNASNASLILAAGTWAASNILATASSGYKSLTTSMRNAMNNTGYGQNA